MDRSCSDAFLSGMCRGEPSEEVDSTLKILVGKGLYLVLMIFQCI